MFRVVEGHVGPTSMVEAGLQVERGLYENLSDALWDAQRYANLYQTKHHVIPQSPEVRDLRWWGPQMRYTMHPEVDHLGEMVKRLEWLKDKAQIYIDAFNKDYPVDHPAMLDEFEQAMERVVEQSERMV